MAGEIATEEEEGREPPPGARPQWLSALAERWGRQRGEGDDAMAGALKGPEWMSRLIEQWRDERAELDVYLADPASFKRVSVPWDLSRIPEYNTVTVQCWGPTVLTGTSDPTVCPRCKPGRCDGTTLDCTLDSYYANPANGPRPSAFGGTAQNPAPQRPCPGCNTNPCKGGYSACSAFRGYTYLPTYPVTRYDEHSVPVPKCECGSGSSVRSGAHSHWCPCWVAP